MKKVMLFIVSLVMIFSFSGPAVAGLNDGLVAYYPFNGNANDESGNGNNGTVYGATLTDDRFGNTGSAYDFDGIDDYVDIKKQLLSNADFTVGFWLKSTGSQNALSVPISQGHGGNSGKTLRGFAFQYNYPSPESLSFIWGDDSAWRSLNFDYFLETDSSWHFLIVTKDGNTLNIFKNGNLKGTDSSYPLVFGTYNFNIGRDTENAGYNHRAFTGVIDDIRIYDRALSEAEIQELYDGVTTTTTTTSTTTTTTTTTTSASTTSASTTSASTTSASTTSASTTSASTTSASTTSASTTSASTTSASTTSASTTSASTTSASTTSASTTSASTTFTSTTSTSTTSSTTTTTLPSSPTITTGSARPDSTSATLNGTIKPNGVATTYYFEYGKTSNYGLFTATKMVESGAVNDPVVGYIPELSPNTSYHYRLVGYNSFGMIHGEDLNFTTSVVNPVTESKVIIVAGGGPYAGNNIWDEVEMVASYAFAALLYQGYTKDTIYFLSPNTLYDVNGDGVPDVDADATGENLEYAIKSWAKDVSQLIIFLVGHGGVEKFNIGQKEEIDVQTLDAWLDDTQNNIEQVVVIYDACHSGSFVSLFAPPTEKKRILAASTKSDQNALISAKGTLSFSYLFWSHIFNGDSFYDSFVSAKNSLAIVYPDRQNSQIEGNGNGIGNEKEDKTLSESVELGLGVKSAGKLPEIGDVSASPEAVSVGGPVEISARDVHALEGISKVWAVITPPGISNTPDGPVATLPILNLLEDNGLYKGTYSDFTIEGIYNVAVFVEDKQGFLSLPVKTTVTVGGCLSVAGDLSMMVPCVEYNGTKYAFTLGFYQNPDNLSGYHWNLVRGTLSAGTGPDCIPIGSDLSMPMSCVSYNGKQYGFTLDFHNNSYDPSGLYWMMDMSTLEMK